MVEAPTPTPVILVVDDQETIRSIMQRALEQAGFAVETCMDGPAAVARIASDPPALVVLDVGLPGMDGLSVLREIRRHWDIPVVMLTARDEEFDRVLGLELGADDYESKPFSARELAARVKSVLRRTQPRALPAGVAPDHRDGAPEPASGISPAADDPEVLVHGDLVEDLVTREVRPAGGPVPTTRREFDLLAVLCSAPRRVLSREQLLHAVWESSSDGQPPPPVTEHIRRLRLKLEVDPNRPTRIVTVRGVGYRFVPPPS